MSEDLSRLEMAGETLKRIIKEGCSDERLPGRLAYVDFLLEQAKMGWCALRIIELGKN